MVEYIGGMHDGTAKEQDPKVKKAFAGDRQRRPRAPWRSVPRGLPASRQPEWHRRPVGCSWWACSPTVMCGLVAARSVRQGVQKVLTQALRGLERNGLVRGNAHVEVPERVEYAPHRGQAHALGALGPSQAWAIAHLENVASSQAA